MLTMNRSKGVFSDTYADMIRNSINNTQTLYDKLSTVQTKTNFQNGALDQQLKQVSRLMEVGPSLGTERAGFIVSVGGWDMHHSYEGFANKVSGVNNAVKAFADEMKLKGKWNDVTVVMISEFGRSLTTNGLGTDHAWGGNYFVAGGDVKGGQILGEYPKEVKAGSYLNLGRGRMLPTTSWEAIWNGIS